MQTVCLPRRSLGEGGLVNRVDDFLAGKHRKPFHWRFFVLAHQSATINECPIFLGAQREENDKLCPVVRMKNKAANIRILTVRDRRVVLDADLAMIYGVSTKRLNEQFRRNRKRFAEDFAFQLTAEEYGILRSRFATLKLGRGQHRKYSPWAFTEHGAL